MSAPLTAPFFLQKNSDAVDRAFEEKNAVAARILGWPALRQMRPEAVGDRTRLDLMWREGSLGIRGASESDFHEIRDPDSASAGILRMMKALNADPAPLPLAQLRFREGPGGLCGLWIDCSNESIKALLDEREWIGRWQAQDFRLELGQKHKSPGEKEGRLGLVAAEPACWLASYNTNNDEVPLKSYMGLFSQPGPEANRAMIAAGFELLDTAGVGEARWIEWGAGYGNLSAAYASRLGTKATVSELEPTAAELLAQNAAEFFAGVETRRLAAESPEAPGPFDLWLIDPPRPGFPKLLGLLKTLLHRPQWLLAYHCTEAGLGGDTAILREAGYKLDNWSSVDAFAATPHHEVISLWRRK